MTQHIACECLHKWFLCTIAHRERQSFQQSKCMVWGSVTCPKLFQQVPKWTRQLVGPNTCVWHVCCGATCSGAPLHKHTCRPRAPEHNRGPVLAGWFAIGDCLVFQLKRGRGVGKPWRGRGTPFLRLVGGLGPRALAHSTTICRPCCPCRTPMKVWSSAPPPQRLPSSPLCIKIWLAFGLNL